MSKTDSLIVTVRWCIDRCLDPMIKNKLQEALGALSEPQPTTSERLRSLLNVIPHPGVHLYVDAEVFQLLSDLYTHFAACEAMINQGEALNANDPTHP